VVTNLRLPGQYDERMLGILGLQGPYYNWNRWYLPGVGRYLELDPLALQGRANGAYGPDWSNYANGNPLTYTDRMGLYGTKCCGYYEYRCQQTGGSYYCSMAKKACHAFPTPGSLEPWGDCVRKCLQDWDKRYPPDPGPVCSPDSPPTLPFAEGTAVAHAFCWWECRNPDLNPYTQKPEPNDLSCPAEYW
jgi:RHS repeat-associated protein